MKTLKNLVTAFLLAGGIAMGSANAQDMRSSQVPSVVVNSFKKNFPQAVGAEWEMKKGLYEVEFDVKRMDYVLWFDAQGEIVKMKREMRSRDLPDAVRAEVKKQFKGYRLDDIEKLVKGGQTVYKIELNSWRDDFDIFVDENGQVVEGFIWD